MTWSQSETDIYEQALKAVEKNNKLLARMYLKTQKDIAEKLKEAFIKLQTEHDLRTCEVKRKKST